MNWSQYNHWHLYHANWKDAYVYFKPSIDALLGRMVTAPSATSSWSRMGELLAPQLSDPTNLNWPVKLDFLAASRTCLDKKEHN